MPIVKQSWVKTPEALEKYLAKDRNAETITTVSEGLAEGMAETIRNEHEKHRKNVKNLALTIIQSWSEKESDLFPPEKYNEMGQELAKRIAPGHLAWVVTHTEKNHIHNHIVICSVHSESGKLLTNKRSELAKLHEANNAIARENGFSVIDARVNADKARLPQKVRSMVAQGKDSWYFDLVQKADFSRAVSTSFDEFVGTMKGLGIDVRVEEKNISYFYGDHKKAIRGKRLGKKFNKEGLVEAFKENDERFAKHPSIREQLRSDLGAAFDSKGRAVGTPSHLLLESASHPRLRIKDYNQFTKIERRRIRDELPAIFDERGGPLYAEMMKARKLSIFDYCEQNKIKLVKNQKGQTVLRGKEFVAIKSSGEWINTKSGVSGNVIDFVRIHMETDYLRAIAKINGNPRLLLLEHVMGEYRRGFQAFYFPKPKQAAPQLAMETLHRFLAARGIRGESARTLLKSRNVHVGADKSVWFMGEKGDSAMEFREERDGKWSSKRHGNPAGVFLESVAKSKRLSVFRDPFEFALFRGQAAHRAHQDGSILVFMGEDTSDRRLYEFLALHSHIAEVHIVQSAKAERMERDRLVFHEVKRRLDPFSIEVRPLVPSDLGKDRGRGPDIGI